MTAGSPASSDIRSRLFSSFGVQTLAVGLRIVQQIVLVPILIAAWGTELYQDWIIIFSASALFAMVDFGTQIYFGNALMIAWSRRDMVTFRRLFATAMGIYAVIIAVVAVLLFGATTVASWPLLLGTQGMNDHTALWTFLPMVAATLGLVPLGIFTGLYRVYGDYVHGTVLVVIADAGRGFGVCLVAFSGGTPIVAAWAYLVIASLLWLAVVRDLRRRFGPIPFSLGLPTMSELRDAVSRSALYFVPTVVTPIVLNLPIILLGKLGAVPGAVVAFSVARTFTGFVRQIVLQMCHPIGCEIARQQALDDTGKLGRLFKAGGRLTSGMAGLLSGFTLVVADAFIRIWTHGAVVFDPWLVGAFLVTIICAAPAQVALTMFLYNNKPGILVFAQGGYAIGTVVFCALLIKGFSAAGAAAGTGLAECVSIGLLVPFAATRQIRLNLGLYLGQCYLVAAMAFSASWGVAWALNQLIQAQSLIFLMVLGGAWAIVVALPSYFLLLSSAERDWLYFHGLARFSRISTFFRRQVG